MVGRGLQQQPAFVVSQEVGCELACPSKSAFVYPSGSTSFFVLLYSKQAVKTEESEVIGVMHQPGCNNRRDNMDYANIPTHIGERPVGIDGNLFCHVVLLDVSTFCASVVTCPLNLLLG